MTHFVSIPYPPSVNEYWKRTRSGMTFLPRRVLDFRHLVIAAVQSARGQSTLPKDTLKGKLEVLLEVYPPDRRTRDLDNICKGALDALTHATVWEDDSQINRLTLQRMNVEKPGRVVVFIKENDDDSRD